MDRSSFPAMELSKQHAPNNLVSLAICPQYHCGGNNMPPARGGTCPQYHCGDNNMSPALRQQHVPNALVALEQKIPKTKLQHKHIKTFDTRHKKQELTRYLKQIGHFI